MPGGDRTGPAGAGPMTGRAAGFCAGYPVPGTMNPVSGRGFGGGWGGGRGGGRGRRNRFYATGLTGWQRAAMGSPAWGAVPYGVAPQAAPFVPAAPTREQELEMLKEQAEYVAKTLEDIKQRIGQLQPQE